MASRLVVAIDFGTTFTGVAFYHSPNPFGAAVEERDVQRIAQQIEMIDNWPQTGHLHYSGKTPSVISYHNPDGTHTWGGRVRPIHHPQVSRFKLGLEPAVVAQYGYTARPDGY